MAIEVKNFSYVTNASNNKAEVLAWLQENAADLFDTIATDSGSSNRIRCTKGNSYFTIPFGRSNLGQFSLNGSTSVNICHGQITSSSGNGTFSNAYKTSNGIALRDYDTGFLWIFSKTKQGHTCFAGVYSKSASAVYVYTWFDFDVSATYVPQFSQSYTPETIYSVTTFIDTTTKCVIFPLAFSGGDYSENTFRVPIITNKVFGVVSLDNTEYVTDSIFALKG